MSVEENGIAATQTRIQEIEERRAKRKEATAKARDEQYAKDLEQIDRIEQELGDDRVTVLEMPSFVAGLPTVVVVKTPSKGVVDRFRQMVRKAGKNAEALGAAADLLYPESIVYPDKDIFARMVAEWPSIQDDVTVAAVRHAEARGKG